MIGSGIYVITNTINGKMYVGSSVEIQRRWNQHRSLLRNNQHTNKKLQNSWNKYSEAHFTFEVIVKDVPHTSLCAIEQFWICVFDACNEGYNLAKVAGSVAGMTHSDEAKAKISAAMQGREMSDEWRAKISVANSAPRQPMSEETKQKIREANTGFKHSEETKAKLSALQKGKKKSSEAVAKVSAAMKGRKISEETRAKMSAAKKGKKKSPEAIANATAARKRNKLKRLEESKK